MCKQCQTHRLNQTGCRLREWLRGDCSPWLPAWWVDHAVMNHRVLRSAALFSLQCEKSALSDNPHTPSILRPQNILLKPIPLIWKWLCALSMSSHFQWCFCLTSSLFLNQSHGKIKTNKSPEAVLHCVILMVHLLGTIFCCRLDLRWQDKVWGIKLQCPCSSVCGQQWRSVAHQTLATQPMLVG